MFSFAVILFWMIVLVITFVIEALSRNYKGAGAPSIFLAIVLVVAYFLGMKEAYLHTWAYIVQNPSSIFLYAVGYIAVGFVWSLAKWRGVALRAKKLFDTVSYTNKVVTEYIPDTADFKSQIIAWMMYWPISMFYYILDSPLVKFFTFIYTKTIVLYDRVALGVFDVPVKKASEHIDTVE